MVLLRMDVYPHNATLGGVVEETTTNNNNSQRTNHAVVVLPKSPQDPLYVCLATCSSSSSGSSRSSNNGTIVTVGRKEGDVVFPSDKSVSRQHLKLRIVSRIVSHQQPLQDDQGNIVAGAAAIPSNPEEVQACCDAADRGRIGMCVTLDDCGSKFGSYLVVNKKKLQNQPKPACSEEDDTTCDDDTDNDEGTGASTHGGGVPLSEMTAKIVPNSANCCLQKLAPNSSVVLHALTTNATNNAADDAAAAVFIQCGQNGSTIRLTRVPMNVAWSRVGIAPKQSWMDKLYALGASSTDDLMDMTLLVTKDKVISAAKPLTAWCRAIPICTTEYLQQCLDRTSSKGPLPSCTYLQGKEAFWKTVANSNLWSNATLLALQSNEMVALIQAAGANVVRLYQHDDNDNEIDNMQAFRTRLDGILEQTDGCFFVDTSSNKVSKQVAYLKQRGLPCCTQKQIASLVTLQRPLVDAQGNKIGDPKKQEHSEDKPTRTSNTKKRGRQAVLLAVEPSSSLQVVVESEHDSPTAVGPVDGSEQDERSPRNKRTKRTTRANSSFALNKETYHDDVVPICPEKLSPATRTNMDATPKRVTAKKKNDQDGARKMKASTTTTATTSKQKIKNTNDVSETPRDRVGKRKKVDTPDDSETNPKDRSGKREHLATSSGGWLVAAPSGSKRNHYRRSNTELREKYENFEILDQLPTDSRTNLVVSQQNPSSASTTTSSTSVFSNAATTQQRSRAMNGAVVNFKKFRKNSIDTAGLFRISRIKLRSVLPKESEREQEMHNQERELLDEKRIADALFRDPNAGVRSFFGTSAKKTRKPSSRGRTSDV